MSPQAKAPYLAQPCLLACDCVRTLPHVCRLRPRRRTGVAWMCLFAKRTDQHHQPWQTLGRGCQLRHRSPLPAPRRGRRWTERRFRTPGQGTRLQLQPPLTGFEPVPSRAAGAECASEQSAQEHSSGRSAKHPLSKKASAIQQANPSNQFTPCLKKSRGLILLIGNFASPRKPINSAPRKLRFLAQAD